MKFVMTDSSGNEITVGRMLDEVTLGIKVKDGQVFEVALTKSAASGLLQGLSWVTRLDGDE